jgi:hypothetical protein
MKTIKFELNPKELEIYNRWIENLPKKYLKLETEFIFSNGSGIGVISKARKGAKEVDLTDYSCW